MQGYIQVSRIDGSRNCLLPSQGRPDPIHLHRTHPARIAAVGEHELVVHDRLDFLAKQHTRRVDGHRLVPNYGPVAAIGHQAGGVGCEATEEAL